MMMATTTLLLLLALAASVSPQRIWSWPEENIELDNGDDLAERLVNRNSRSVASHSDNRDINALETPAAVKREHKTRYCGNQLVNAIKLVCLNAARGKRSADDSEEDAWSDLSLINAGGFGSVNRLGHTDRFRTVSTILKLRKRGAADVCCLEPCSLRVLRTFC